MDSKQILTLNKRQSIVQRIDAMKASFSANKIKDKLSRYHYFGYSSQLVDKLIGKIPPNAMNKNSTIAVVNDFGLEVISQLQMLGYTNLILLCTESDDKLYNIIKYMVEKEFNFNKIVRLEENMEDKFDLIIANPPYEIGNQITKNILENIRFNTYVNLMPLSKYKSNKLFQHVHSMELIDPSLFEDAAITDNLNIAIIKSENCNDLEWEDFEIDSYDPKFNSFHKANQHRCKPYIILPNMPDKYDMQENKYKFDPNTDFMLTSRCNTGIPKSNNTHDYYWNVKNKFEYALAYMIRFKSNIEKQNLAKWWYSKGLSSKVVSATHKSGGGRPYLNIPNIDWSRTDVDYTDDYVLSQMGLKWNENRDGVEKL